VQDGPNYQLTPHASLAERILAYCNDIEDERQTVLPLVKGTKDPKTDPALLETICEHIRVWEQQRVVWAEELRGLARDATFPDGLTSRVVAGATFPVGELLVAAAELVGNLNDPFAVFQTDAGRTAGTRPFTVPQRGPWSSYGRGSHDWVFRRSIARLSDSLSTLRRAGYPTPRKTRFQLLVRLYWTGFSPARFR
jgi:hypothetical protein